MEWGFDLPGSESLAIELDFGVVNSTVSPPLVPRGVRFRGGLPLLVLCDLERRCDDSWSEIIPNVQIWKAGTDRASHPEY